MQFVERQQNFNSSFIKRTDISCANVSELAQI